MERVKEFQIMIDEFQIMIDEYVFCDDSKLTPEAIKLKRALIEVITNAYIELNY